MINRYTASHLLHRGDWQTTYSELVLELTTPAVFSTSIYALLEGLSLPFGPSISITLSLLLRFVVFIHVVDLNDCHSYRTAPSNIDRTTITTPFRSVLDLHLGAPSRSLPGSR